MTLVVYFKYGSMLRQTFATKEQALEYLREIKQQFEVMSYELSI